MASSDASSMTPRSALKKRESKMTLAQIQETRDRASSVANKLEASGYLLKQSPGFFKGWQQRWFILHGRRIYYFREDPKLDPGQEYKNFIELHYTTRVILQETKAGMKANNPCIFRLESESATSRSYTLCAMGITERDKWVKAIESVIADLREDHERKSLERMRQEEEIKERHRLYTLRSTGTTANASSLPTTNALARTTTTIVDVVVVECGGLGQIGYKNAGDYPCVCEIVLENDSTGLHQYARTSSSVPGTPNPQWHEDFTFVVEHPLNSVLEFSLLTKTRMVKYFMGRVRLPLAPFFLQFFSTSSSSSTANGGITKTVLEVDDKWWELSPRPGVAKDLTRVRGALHLKLQLSLPVSTVDTIGPPLPLLLGEFGLPCGALRQRVDSGDIVLISHWKKASAYVTKALTLSRWDHVGIIVRRCQMGAAAPSTDDTSTTASASSTHSDTTLEDQLFLLEAVQEGVRLHPLHREIEQYKRDGLVAIRRLHLPSPTVLPTELGDNVSSSLADAAAELEIKRERMRQELWEFASRVDGRPYERSMFDMIKALLPRTVEVPREARKRGTTGQVVVNSGRGDEVGEVNLTAMFCSQLVVAGLKVMGVVESEVSSSDYSPAAFGRHKEGMVLAGGVTLGPVRPILSGAAVKQRERERQREQEKAKLQRELAENEKIVKVKEKREIRFDA